VAIERGSAPGDGTRRGWLSAFYEWLTKSSAHYDSSATHLVNGDIRRPRIGHYVIARKLGQGGMGVVDAARDERLERPVALKMMSSQAYDQTARQRFWREARAAARVNHPNVCQIYEIGEDHGDLQRKIDAYGDRRRHPALHGARASDRRRRRHPQRFVCGGRHPV
jgi:hypothetical protein